MPRLTAVENHKSTRNFLERSMNFSQGLGPVVCLFFQKLPSVDSTSLFMEDGPFAYDLPLKLDDLHSFSIPMSKNMSVCSKAISKLYYSYMYERKADIMLV